MISETIDVDPEILRNRYESSGCENIDDLRAEIKGVILKKESD